jgi:hypothetical protein
MGRKRPTSQALLSRNILDGSVRCLYTQLLNHFSVLSFQIMSIALTFVVLSIFLTVFRDGACAAEKLAANIDFSLRPLYGSTKFSYNITTRSSSSLETQMVQSQLKELVSGSRALIFQLRKSGDHGTPMTKSPVTSLATKAKLVLLTSPLFTVSATWLLNGNARMSPSCSQTGSTVTLLTES